MVLSSSEVRFVVVSDIHLGGKAFKTTSIIDNLNAELTNDEVLSSIDILFLAGDVFHKELTTYSAEYSKICVWIARTLVKCHRYGVMVRVLEGTRSHDRGQSVIFETLNEALKKDGLGVDLRYVNALEIEFIEKYQLSVLYVPDDLNNGDTQLTAQQVRKCLDDFGAKQVDLAIMHGSFAHQLPEVAHSTPIHDRMFYEQIVKYLIFIGHIHTPSVLGKCHAQGSFDRLAHNEEHPKGYFKALINAEGYQVTFIENKNAAVFKTLPCYSDSVAENLLYISQQVSSLAQGSNVRIEANVGNPIFENMELVRQRWPLLNWDSVVRGKEKKKSVSVVDHKLQYTRISLDRQTLTPTLLERLKTKGYAPSLIEHSEQLLKQIA